jgi:hypothetical protein
MLLVKSGPKSTGSSVMGLKITPDMINQRLGGSQNNSHQNAQNHWQATEENEGGGAGVGFYAAVAGTFVAIGALTFVFMGDGFSGLSLPTWDQTAFVSKVDPICQPLWKSPGWNNDALACYLVESPQRFCDKQEREHLVSVFTQYRTDIELIRAQAIAEVTVGQKKIYNDIVAQVERQEKGLPPLPSKQKPRAKNKYLPNHSFEENMNSLMPVGLTGMAKKQQTELASLLRVVLEKGYFKTWEFGLIQDKIVTEALKTPLPEVKSPCDAEQGSGAG